MIIYNVIHNGSAGVGLHKRPRYSQKWDVSKAFRSTATVELPLTFSGATDLPLLNPKPLRTQVGSGLHLPAHRRARILVQDFLLPALPLIGGLQETSAGVSVQSPTDIEAQGDTSLIYLLRRVLKTAARLAAHIEKSAEPKAVRRTGVFGECCGIWD